MNRVLRFIVSNLIDVRGCMERCAEGYARDIDDWHKNYLQLIDKLIFN
jgi:hypothetical protein